VGRTEEAITWLQARAEAGDTGALSMAIRLLAEGGRTEEAVRLRRYGIDPGGGIANWWGGERPK
jgi:hypothetical protein